MTETVVQLQPGPATVIQPLEATHAVVQVAAEPAKVIQTEAQSQPVVQEGDEPTAIVQVLQDRTQVVQQAGTQGPPGPPGLGLPVAGITRITASNTPPADPVDGHLWIKTP